MKKLMTAVFAASFLVSGFAVAKTTTQKKHEHKAKVAKANSAAKKASKK